MQQATLAAVPLFVAPKIDPPTPAIVTIKRPRDYAPVDGKIEKVRKEFDNLGIDQQAL